MVLQKKEAGTQVDFGQAREIKLNYYTFQNDNFGVLGTQISPVTVSATVRDAFLNGNLGDIQAQATGQGMNAPYMLITWNETQQANGYLVTDLVIGLVGRPIRDYNTGPSFLMDSAKAIPWFNNFIKAFGINWKAWLLLTAPLHTPSGNTENIQSWTWDGTSASWYESAPIGSPIPDPPATTEVNQHFVTDGRVSDAIGLFVQQILDKGYTVTVLGYSTSICYAKSNEVHPPGSYTHYYEYKTHTRLTVDYQTNAPVWVQQAGTLNPFVLTAWMIIAIGIAIAAVAVGVGGYFALQNLTKTEKSYEEWGWVLNPNTGVWEWRIVKSGKESGPPDWFAWVIPVVALGIGAMVIWRLVPSRRGNRNE